MDKVCNLAVKEVVAITEVLSLWSSLDEYWYISASHKLKRHTILAVSTKADMHMAQTIW